MTDTHHVPPEAVGEDPSDPGERRRTDRAGRGVLGFGTTAVAVFASAAVLFVIMVIVIVVFFR